MHPEYERGEISGNKATGNGGAVYFYEEGDSTVQGKLNISGNPVVKDNTVYGKANNIYLKSGKNLSLSIDHMMTDGASVGTTTESTDYPVVFSSVFLLDVSSYFFADDPDAYVKQDNLRRLVLAKRPTLTTGQRSGQRTAHITGTNALPPVAV